MESGVDNIYKKGVPKRLVLTLLELRNFNLPVKKLSNGNAPYDVLIIILAFDETIVFRPMKVRYIGVELSALLVQTGRAMRRPK